MPAFVISVVSCGWLLEHFNLQNHVSGQVVRLICETKDHRTIKRTIKRIRERFTWKGLHKEVIELVV